MFKMLKMLPFYPVWIFSKMIKTMPRPILDFTAECCGRIMYMIPAFRKIVIANITVAFPEFSRKQVKQTAQKSFANLVRTLLEFFWFSNSPERLNRYVLIAPEAYEMLNRHIQANENIIFVTPHLGNWEATGLKVALSSGLDFAVVVRPPRYEWLNKLIESHRASLGNDIIQAKGAGRAMFKALKAGKSMATLIDQNTRVRDGGVFVNFFGLPVPSSRAPAVFAAKNPKVQLYVAGGVRLPDKRIQTFFEPLPKPQSEYSDDQEMIQDLMSITEKYIRKNPEQYLWFYKRFQYIPRETTDELKSKFPYYATPAPDKFYFKKKHTE